MRRYIFLIAVLFCSMPLLAISLKGKFISQSGQLMFRFVSDSLYVSTVHNQRVVSAFKLVKNKHDEKSTTFNAYEGYTENGRVTYREVLIRVTELKENDYQLEYFGKDKDRDYNSNERYNIKPIEE